MVLTAPCTLHQEVSQASCCSPPELHCCCCLAACQLHTLMSSAALQVAAQCGVMKLASSLNVILVEHIRLMLPQLRSAIDEALEMRLAELRLYGDPLVGSASTSRWVQTCLFQGPVVLEAILAACLTTGLCLQTGDSSALQEPASLQPLTCKMSLLSSYAASEQAIGAICKAG